MRFGKKTIIFSAQIFNIENDSFLGLHNNLRCDICTWQLGVVPGCISWGRVRTSLHVLRILGRQSVASGSGHIVVLFGDRLGLVVRIVARIFACSCTYASIAAYDIYIFLKTKRKIVEYALKNHQV